MRWLRSDEDLFEKSTMSFGEHIEELRRVLFKAAFGWAIALVVAFPFADYAVRFVEAPLARSLERYYKRLAEKEFLTAPEKEFLTAPEKEEAKPSPDAPNGQDELLPRRVQVDARELKRALGLQDALESTPGAAPAAQLVEITIWERAQARIQTLGVPEAFMVWVKAWLVLSFILASPWIFYQLWEFIGAGLYGHERKAVYTYLPMSLGLFFAGVALAFGFVFDPVLDFLFGFNERLEIRIEPRFNDWIGFVLLLPLGFGLSFQLPLVMLALDRIGLVSREWYVEQWRFAILGIFFLSMILTPADPVSMLLMAVPLAGLFFVGLFLCRRPEVGKHSGAE